MQARTYRLLGVLLFFVITCLLFSSYWMFRTFGAVSLSQTLTLLVFDLEGGSLPVVMSVSLAKWAIGVPLCLTAIVCIAEFLRVQGRLTASLGVLSLMAPGILLFAWKVNFKSDSKPPLPALKGESIYDQYHAIVMPERPQGRPLNVIWVFVESLEKEYRSKEINGELDQATEFMTPLNVSPLLNRYTIGGVMSAKCAAPIYFNYRLVLQLQNPGFNRATCFDDVLRNHGYDAYFVVGHDADNSGFRHYYERHAAAKIYDQKYLASKGVYKNSDFPTYPDEEVFKTALGILKSTALRKPYSLNILTLDNHAPSGFPSRSCTSQYGTEIANVIRCDNHLLSEFIQELRRSGVLEDTVLVVMGDHPFMGAFEQQAPVPNIFAKIYSPLEEKKVINNTPAPFDFFPSVLSAMGFSVGTLSYGYGYSFYDVSTYPDKNWKSRLEIFQSSAPTETYKELFR